MAAIFVKHLEGEELTAVESLKLQGRCYRDMRHWENIYYQVCEGMLSEEEWSGFRRNLAALFVIPAYQDYWSNEASLYSASFQNEVRDARAAYKEESSSNLAERFITSREDQRGG